MDIHFIRDKVQAKEIDLRHVPTTDQIADIFTKPLSNQFFTKLRNKLGVSSLSSLELRGSVNVAVVDQTESASPIQSEKSKAQAEGSEAASETCPAHHPKTSWKDVLLSNG